MSDCFAEMFSTLLDEPAQTGEAKKASCDAQKMGMTEDAHASSMNGAVLVEAAANANDEIPILLDRKAPQYVRQQELPWHRTTLEYAAQGFTAREIAGMIGCSPTAVQDILRQPQYQKTQVNLIKKEVSKDKQVVDYIKENVLAAVETLGSIIKDNKAKPADRIAAAREMLNRRYGMPNQPINRNTDVDLSKLSDSELAQMLVSDNVTTTVTGR